MISFYRPKNRDIFDKTKDKLKDDYKYIWVKDGVMLVKRNDTSTTKRIRSLEDLEDL